jgi:hypothetical protein
MDDNYKVRVKMYRKQGGEYRLLPFKFPEQEFCSAIQNDPYVYPDIAKHSNISYPLECPIADVRRR